MIRKLFSPGRKTKYIYNNKIYFYVKRLRSERRTRNTNNKHGKPPAECCATDARYTRTWWGRRRSRFFSLAAVATAAATERRFTVPWRPLPAVKRVV